MSDKPHRPQDYDSLWAAISKDGFFGSEIPVEELYQAFRARLLAEVEAVKAGEEVSSDVGEFKTKDERFTLRVKP
jgi:hypothetical protein